MTTITRRVVVNGAEVLEQVRDPSIAVSPRCIHTGGRGAISGTDGNDTTPVITETYISEFYVPEPMLFTGAALLNGSAAAGNVTVWLTDYLGAQVRGSKSASTAQSGTNTYQKIDFGTPVTLYQGSWYLCVQFSSTSARFRSYTFGVHGGGKATGQTFGTSHSITAATTTTANLSPIASFY